MNLSIRVKILLSFLLLVVMLISAGTLAIFEFRKLSFTVGDLIENNYNSIVAGEAMRDALEREDSGVLLLLLGNMETGRTVLSDADSLFLSALQIASNNITESGESTIIEAIESDYALFRAQWSKPIVNTEKEGNLNWYSEVLHPQFLDVKSNIQVLLDLNQERMHHLSADVHSKARRAIMPGLVAIGGSLIFLLILNYFIKSFLVTPLVSLLERIRFLAPGNNPFRQSVNSKDEIVNLESEISRLIDRTNR